MLNITNEGWFGDTAAPHQMLAINVFRAIENRVVLARAANTGISCFIDPTGHITGRVEDEKGKATFVQGYLTQEVNIYKGKTFYTCYGDVFVYTILVITGFLIAVAIMRPKNS